MDLNGDSWNDKRTWNSYVAFVESLKDAKDNKSEQEVLFQRFDDATECGHLHVYFPSEKALLSAMEATRGRDTSGRVRRCARVLKATCGHTSYECKELVLLKGRATGRVDAKLLEKGVRDMLASNFGNKVVVDHVFVRSAAAIGETTVELWMNSSKDVETIMDDGRDIKINNIFFTKSAPNCPKRITCSNCGGTGHLRAFCPFVQGQAHLVKLVLRKPVFKHGVDKIKAALTAAGISFGNVFTGLYDGIKQPTCLVHATFRSESDRAKAEGVLRDKFSSSILSVGPGAGVVKKAMCGYCGSATHKMDACYMLADRCSGKPDAPKAKKSFAGVIGGRPAPIPQPESKAVGSFADAQKLGLCWQFVQRGSCPKMPHCRFSHAEQYRGVRRLCFAEQSKGAGNCSRRDCSYLHAAELEKLRLDEQQLQPVQILPRHQQSQQQQSSGQGQPAAASAPAPSSSSSTTTPVTPNPTPVSQDSTTASSDSAAGDSKRSTTKEAATTSSNSSTSSNDDGDDNDGFTPSGSPRQLKRKDKKLEKEKDKEKAKESTDSKQDSAGSRVQTRSSSASAVALSSLSQLSKSLPPRLTRSRSRPSSPYKIVSENDSQ